MGDELHHAGWNICSSCPDSKLKRDTFVLPCLMSDRVYFIDTSNARAPAIKKVRLFSVNSAGFHLNSNQVVCSTLVLMFTVPLHLSTHMYVFTLVP